jgi:Abortive infection C-terminus
VFWLPVNTELLQDGWQLEAMQILGDEAKFRATPWYPAYSRAADSLQRSALVLSGTWMFQEIQRIEASINSDPALAIGTAKELIDTCCKHVLDVRGIVLSGKPDTPDLVKAVLEDLKLVPAGISDQAKGAEIIKKTLRTRTTLTQGLAEIRNLYGTGHGKDVNHRGLQPRHARLL